jgi:hypothetical protein
MSAWDDDVGNPNHHVSMSQAIAPRIPETVNEVEGEGNENDDRRENKRIFHRGSTVLHCYGLKRIGHVLAGIRRLLEELVHLLKFH